MAFKTGCDVACHARDPSNPSAPFYQGMIRRLLGVPTLAVLVVLSLGYVVFFDYLRLTLGSLLHGQPKDSCLEWNPSLPAKDDPPDCWRSIKYRQILALPYDLVLS